MAFQSKKSRRDEIELPLRVLFVIAHDAGRGERRGANGPEVRILTSLHLWDRHRVKPLLAYAREGRFAHLASRAEGWWHLPFSTKRLPLLLPKLRQILRISSAHLVHCYGPVAVDFFTALAAKMASMPCVVTRPAMVSHLEFPRPIKRMYRCMDRMTFRWAARVVAVSESGRDILSADGCATTKLEVIHNGTDIHRFHPGVRPRDDLEGPPSWGLNIAVVGTMKSIKRHDRVMQAAAMARTHGRRWRLIFAGDGPERLTLEALAAALGIQDQVRFLGFVEDMPAVYAACDLAALPSLREGMPMTLMEAMACGKPVVASEVGGVAELVGRAGVLLKKADAESLYAAFRHLEDKEIRRRMGRIGRERVLAHYRVEGMIKKLEDLYLSCVHLP